MGLEKLFNQKMPHDDNKNNEQGFVYHRMGTNNGNPNWFIDSLDETMNRVSHGL